MPPKRMFLGWCGEFYIARLEFYIKRPVDVFVRHCTGKDVKRPALSHGATSLYTAINALVECFRSPDNHDFKK